MANTTCEPPAFCSFLKSPRSRSGWGACLIRAEFPRGDNKLQKVPEFESPPLQSALCADCNRLTNASDAAYVTSRDQRVPIFSGYRGVNY